MIMSWAGHIARMRKTRNSYVLMGKSEGKRPIERHGRGWEENIKMDFKEIR
jgi:hypothetical protein